MENAGLESRIGRFLAERGEADPSAELARIAAELDADWWRGAERLLFRAAREGGDRLSFSAEDRLFLDAGLLDYRLVPGGEANRPTLLRELYTAGPPHHYYFSEWLAQRFHQFVVYGRMKSRDAETRRIAPKLRVVRMRLYERIAPLFADLPGFNKKAVDHFLSGNLDETLDAMAGQLERQPDEAIAGQRRQLLDLRNGIMSRARERARGDDDLSFFDAVRKLDQQAEAERFFGSAEPPPPADLQPPERDEFLRGELRLVHSLINLGVTGGEERKGSAVAKAASVLVTAERRVAKADLESVLARVRTCDPLLPGERSILIAPYRGGGFYEWDRDTVFVPLVSTGPADEAIVAALANYRIMVDTLQQGGRMKREYGLAFGAEEFHDRFVRDYKAWILGVGAGRKDALDAPRYTFFRDFIGPQAFNLYAPREWSALTPDEWTEMLKKGRARADHGEAVFEDRYRLAIGYAREQRHAEALRELQAALRLMPVDGRALLAAGQLAARIGGVDTARRLYAECLALAPGSLWAVYAADETAKL